MNHPLVILTGPTAVGKTELSIALAKKIGGEIISADSMQVYRHMDIGSAKINTEQMSGIRHYMIDICEPTDDFNVVIFQNLAKKAAQEIYSHNRIPIVVGGTGFYIQALLYDIDFTSNEENTEYREKLEQIAETEGGQVLYERLRKLDPSAALQIHPNNIKRVIRALEFYELSGGYKISEHNEKERQKEAAYTSAYFVLNDNREDIYKRIDKRVDQMIHDGLVDEVQKLKDMGMHRNMVSMQGLGYKEILAFLDGEDTLENAIRIIKRDTKHFAKRQITWFKREKDVIWIQKNEYPSNEAILDKMIKDCKNAGILS